MLVRIVKFATVGVANTLIDFGLFSLLATTATLSPVAANIISYSVGIGNSYLWNRHWTWADRRSVSAAGEAAKFVTANLGGLLVNTGVVWLMIRALGSTTALAATSIGVTSSLMSKAVALIASTLFSFVALNRWVFLGTEHRGSRED